jgi:hypothetical protein
MPFGPFPGLTAEVGAFQLFSRTPWTGERPIARLLTYTGQLMESKYTDIRVHSNVTFKSKIPVLKRSKTLTTP